MSNHWRQPCSKCGSSYGSDEDGTLVACFCIPDHVYKTKVITLLEEILARLNYQTGGDSHVPE